MSKEAMKLALEALEKAHDESLDEDHFKCRQILMGQITALREALAEQPAQGCEYCNNALYAGTKCKNCGRVTEQAAIKRDLTPEQPAQQEPVAWCPDACPITGLPFFMWIEHHETGQRVPTYGGPYDSYTIPVRDKDGSYCRERYDHDRGGWLTDEVEDVGVQIVSDQAFVYEDERPQAREPLTREQVKALTKETGYDTASWQERADFINGIRHAEAAHGIKENT